MASIRIADAGDAAALAELGRRTFRETFAAHNRPEDMDAYMEGAFDVGRIADEIREPGSAYLLAEGPGGAIGLARLVAAAAPPCIDGPSPVRLARLYVSADAIGTGVGAALMRSGIAWARGAGHGSLWLGVWEHNHRARAFYERRGFAPVGSETFRLGDDDQLDILMQLILGEPDAEAPGGPAR